MIATGTLAALALAAALVTTETRRLARPFPFPRDRRLYLILPASGVEPTLRAVIAPAKIYRSAYGASTQIVVARRLATKSMPAKTSLSRRPAQRHRQDNAVSRPHRRGDSRRGASGAWTRRVWLISNRKCRRIPTQTIFEVVAGGIGGVGRILTEYHNLTLHDGQARREDRCARWPSFRDA